MGTNFHTPLVNIPGSGTPYTKAAWSIPPSELDRAITYQQGKIIVTCDGTVTWASGVLTWSGTIHIFFTSAAGLAIHNSIAAGNISVTDAYYAYVTLNETNNTVLTAAQAVITPTAASTFFTYNRLVLGYRNAADDVFYPMALVSCMDSIVSGFITPTALTIASGAITVSGINKFRAHILDTQDAAATDDLTTITGGNVGDLLTLQCANGARVVVCKKGTSLRIQSDFTLNNVYDNIVLKCYSSGVWTEYSRASNS